MKKLVGLALLVPLLVSCIVNPTPAVDIEGTVQARVREELWTPTPPPEPTASPLTDREWLKEWLYFFGEDSFQPLGNAIGYFDTWTISNGQLEQIEEDSSGEWNPFCQRVGGCPVAKTGTAEIDLLLLVTNSGDMARFLVGFREDQYAWYKRGRTVSKSPTVPVSIQEAYNEDLSANDLNFVRTNKAIDEWSSLNRSTQACVNGDTTSAGGDDDCFNRLLGISQLLWETIFQRYGVLFNYAYPLEQEQVPSPTPQASTGSDAPTPGSAPSPVENRPKDPLVVYGIGSVLEWTVYSVLQSPLDLANLVRAKGAVYAPYNQGEAFFPTTEEPGYDNGGVIASDMELILRGASPTCLGYNLEVLQYPGHGEGTKRWGQLTIVFDGIDLSPVGMATDSEVVKFVYVVEEFSDQSGLVAIVPVPSWAVSSETQELSSCSEDY